MKRIILFVVAALALSARPVFGGIDLSWSSCAADGGVTDLTLDCGSPGTTHRLFGCFRSPSDLGISYLDGQLDIQFESGGELPDFWVLDGGCNSTAFTVGAVDPVASCPTVQHPWGSVGEVLTFVQPGSVPGRTRLGITVWRSDGSTFPIVAGQSTFAFEVAISMANGTSCSGCNAVGVIAWNWARAFGTGGESADVTASGSSIPCVRFNGGSGETCDVVPARRDTWGAIKSLYR